MDSGADPRRARRNLTHQAAHYRAHAQVPLELGMRLLDHLEGLRITPARILSLGCGPGLLRAELARLFPDSTIVLADAVPALLAQIPSGSWLPQLLGRRAPVRLACSADALPLRNGCIDLLVAHDALLWSEPARFFAEARRVLGRDGLLLFSTLGPDTLKEWRTALAFARPGWPDPLGRSVLHLPDMHDLADAAAHAGLASPVVDMEQLTVHYPGLDTLLTDLRVVGGGNALHDRPRGLMTPRARARLVQSLERTRTGAGLPQTLEVIYGHAWNSTPLVDAAGRPVIPIHRADPRQLPP